MRELIKLETAYFLNVRCNYLHQGTLKRSVIKLSIYYFGKSVLNFEKRTRPEKDSARRLSIE